MIYSSQESIDFPQVDLLSLLFDHAASRAHEHTALHAEARDPLNVITKCRARHLTRSIAHFLRSTYSIGAHEALLPDASGPITGDVVVAVSTGQSALPCLFFAVVAAGAVFSAASPSSTPADLARQILDVAPTETSRRVLLVCSSDCRDLASEAANIARLPAPCILVFSSYPVVSLRSITGHAVCAFDQELDWRRITDAQELARRTICILYSSGTTGLPKGVLISHLNLVYQVFVASHANRQQLEALNSQSPIYVPRTVAHLPTAHVAGLLSYFLRSFFQGTIVYWMPSFNIDALIDNVDALAITSLFTVPPVWTALAKHARVGHKLSRIRQASTGAAPMGVDVQRAASNMLACDATVSQVYGLSETTGGVTHVPYDMREKAIGSVGVLLPNCFMRLVDDDGADVPAGQPGEALFYGPNITCGYHQNPSANEAAFTSDGWFRSGDVIQVDPSGLLHIVDRKKELIKYKGLQVAPAELENILIGHPAITDAAVIPYSSNGTELPRAYVTLVPSSNPISASDVAEYVAQRVAKHKRLRGGVVFIDAIPRSPSGKILRRQLRDLQNKGGPKL
ncbi:hypothetical protein CDD82_292 [Ophiocordyceps australis]|uniref:AMP-dependent synthetase/ligase domain-containing protein n=1 Tax=Ophiocordyceps australis TaxID=1399860 RepID=A0A2C5YJ45_9HYPO|nr:hypothetical protein CDD82_292 [Ophiocordyceps australis]